MRIPVALTAIALALGIVAAANSQVYKPGGGGGSSSITAGTTVTSTCGALGVLFNNGGVVGCDTGFTYAGSSGNVNMGGSLNLANAKGVFGTTTGAVGINLVNVDSGNNMNVGSASLPGNMQILPGTGHEIRILNAAASAYIMDMNDSRQITFGDNTHDSIWEFYDSTATTGDSALSIRDGAARGSRIRFGTAAGSYNVGFAHAGSGVITVNDGSTTLTATGGMAMSTLSAAGAITNAGITTDSGQTATATVCEDTTTHQFYFGSGTGGICKGTSGRQFKRDIHEVADVDLAQIVALKPSRYFNKEDKGLDPARPQVGLIADEVRAVLPDCADDNTVDYLCVSVMSLNALKQLAAEVKELKRRVH